ncbi:MAG TPA: hypothetical protein VK203_13925 [Nostocaceae cyanobacterium]|nr:hypothetical protein [Nostocaceae cyanobacterium]
MNSRLSRRNLFKALGILITGGVVTGLFPFLNNIFTKKAQAQQVVERVYKNRRYRIITKPSSQVTQLQNGLIDTPQQLFLDNREIRIIRHKPTNKYVSPLLFGEFNSPADIAKTLIDLGIKLPDSEVKLYYNFN